MRAHDLARLRRWIDTLEQVALRCRCGYTFRQAKQAVPLAPPNRSLAREWNLLSERLEAGRLPAADSLAAWAQQLRFRARLAGLVAQRSAAPRAQAWVIGGLGALLAIATHVILPASLHPAPSVLAVSGCLVALGSWWIKRQLRSFERTLWYGEWLQLLSHIGLRLRWGQTLMPALLESLNSFDIRRWPQPLRHALAQALSQSPAPARDAKQKDDVNQRALLQLDALLRLHQGGHPLADFLEQNCRGAWDAFEQELNLRAEHLGLRMLLPLFCCFLPAYALLLLSPLFGSLSP